MTALRAGGYTSVAVSGEIARAVDEVQYADRAGPCVDAISEAVPVAVPDIAVVLVWPGFRQAAVTMGLRVSLSIPLFAGSGVPVASLNLYSRDEAAMAALTCGVYAAFGTSPPAVDGGLVPGVLDAGGQELGAGIAQALAVRATIDQAIWAIRAAQGCTTDEAYRRLKARAADTGASLSDTANPGRRERGPRVAVPAHQVVADSSASSEWVPNDRVVIGPWASAVRCPGSVCFFLSPGAVVAPRGSLVLLLRQTQASRRERSGHRRRGRPTRLASAALPGSTHDLNALLAAKAAGHDYVNISGILVETDRCRTPGPTAGVDLWWSGKHDNHGGNVQVVTVPDGWPIWTSDVRPGREHDTTAVRTHAEILPTLTTAGSDPRTLGDLGYEGESGAITVAFKKPKNSKLNVIQQQLNKAHNSLRAIGERGNSLLKMTFKALRNVSLNPWRIGKIVAAALAVLHIEHDRTT